MRSSEVCRASGNDAPMWAEDLVRFVSNHLLAAVELHGRKELAVGELRHSFDGAVYTRVLLDVIVPRRDVGVADRPVYGDPVLRVCLEVEITPAIALAAPHQRPSADVITAIPVEALYLGVRRIPAGCPVIEVGFIKRIIGLEGRIQFLHRSGASTAVRVLPRRLGRVHVVLDVFDVLATLEHQDAQPFLRELFGCPTSGNPGSHYDCVVLLRLHLVLAIDSEERTSDLWTGSEMRAEYALMSG